MPTFPRNLLTPRFSLRALLVVVTVGCLTLGWRANRYLENKRAIAALRQSGLETYTRMPEVWGHHISFFGNVNLHDVQLLPEAEWSEGKYEPAPRVWWEVSRLAPLRELGLENIDLPTKKESDQSRHRNGVTDVDFDRCRFRGDSFEVAIGLMPNLEIINLSDCKLENPDFGVLTGLRSLVELKMDSMDLAPGSFITLSVKSLRRLHIGRSGWPIRGELSDEDIRSITSMNDLEELSINCSHGFPEGAISNLKACKHLKTLEIRLRHKSKKATEDVGHELGAALPSCKINAYSDADE